MKAKYDYFIGVPCSKLKKFMEENDCIIATREDEAVAMAVGMHLAGKTVEVVIQNSGLGNCTDIITSLLKPYDISIPFYISVRKHPEHHSFMGKITRKLLDLMEYYNWLGFEEEL